MRVTSCELVIFPTSRYFKPRVDLLIYELEVAN